MLTIKAQVPHADNRYAPCSRAQMYSITPQHRQTITHMFVYMDAHLPTHNSECFHFWMFAFSVNV